jgi:hypothetical protein
LKDAYTAYTAYIDGLYRIYLLLAVGGGVVTSSLKRPTPTHLALKGRLYLGKGGKERRLNLACPYLLALKTLVA